MSFVTFDGGYYNGDIMGGVAHGYGEIYYDNGNSYRGEWKNGKFHGHGTYYNANGNRYVGEFAHDERHGNGTMYFAKQTAHDVKEDLATITLCTAPIISTMASRNMAIGIMTITPTAKVSYMLLTAPSMKALLITANGTEQQPSIM